MYFFRPGYLGGIHSFHFCAMDATFEYYCGINLWELKRYKQRAPKGGIAVRKVFQLSPNGEPQKLKN
jgi:hypothetical protein